MRIVFTMIAFHLVALAFGQSPSALDEKGGFKDILLLSPIDSVDGTKLKKEFTEKNNVFPSAYYEVNNPNYSSIGDVSINSLEIETYHNLIYKIVVYTEKDERLMKALENVLGRATYNSRENLYFWATEKIVLTFESHGKKQLKLVYRSNEIPRLMKADREKKVEKISSDF